MNNVTINNERCTPKGDTPIKLNNGSLVLYKNRDGSVRHAFIVTSFRSPKYQDSNATTTYCSFIDLDTGYISFEERCSRNTTLKRVLSHLNPNDQQGDKALAAGLYVDVYPLGKYSIDLKVPRKGDM